MRAFLDDSNGWFFADASVLHCRCGPKSVGRPIRTLSLTTSRCPAKWFGSECVCSCGGSSIFGGNPTFIANHLEAASPGLKMMQLPICTAGRCWATISLWFLATPVARGNAGVAFSPTSNRSNTGFFKPGLGGNAVVYQHFSGSIPTRRVYIHGLPPFGLVSEILRFIPASPCSATPRWCKPNSLGLFSSA